jgi:hypothetical protein
LTLALMTDMKRIASDVTGASGLIMIGFCASASRGAWGK